MNKNNNLQIAVLMTNSHIQKLIIKITTGQS